MLVYNEHQKESFDKFKKACDESQYVSFDCEMTGLNLGKKLMEQNMTLKNLDIINKKKLFLS